MEARRAQGGPDDEVLVGPDAQKRKMLGNAVSRQVALALGMSLRQAWFSNTEEQRARVLGKHYQGMHSEDEEDEEPTRPGRQAVSRTWNPALASPHSSLDTDSSEVEDSADSRVSRPERRRVVRRADVIQNHATTTNSTKDVDMIDLCEDSSSVEILGSYMVCEGKKVEIIEISD